MAIIINLSDSDKAEIEIISGGGAAGLLQIGWYSEGSSNKGIFKRIEKICKSNNWILAQRENYNISRGETVNKCDNCGKTFDFLEERTYINPDGKTLKLCLKCFGEKEK